MKSDGKFTILNGGITQGIQKELNLTNEECKQLNCIWNEILKEFENPNNIKVTNNKNVIVNKENNYKVYQNAIIEFSKDCWQNIVSRINQALNKTFETIYDENKNDKILPEILSSEELENWTLDSSIYFLNSKGEKIIKHTNLSEEIKNWEEEYKKTNGEMNFTTAVEYLNDNPNLPNSIREYIKTAFGICDGDINDNKQGMKGTCHLLSCKSELEDCEEIKKLIDIDNIVTQNNDGTVTVTFRGGKDNEGNPWQITFTNQQIKDSYANILESGSSDPDAAALELAYEMYVKEKSKEVKIIKQELENLKDEFNNIEKEKIRVRIIDLYNELKNHRIKDDDLKKIKKYLKQNIEFIKTAKYEDIYNKLENDNMLNPIIDNFVEKSEAYQELENQRIQFEKRYLEIENKYYDISAGMNLNYDPDKLGKSLGNSPQATFALLTGLNCKMVSATKYLPENFYDLKGQEANNASDIAKKNAIEDFLNNENINTIPTVVDFYKKNSDLNIVDNHAYALKRIYTEENTNEKMVVIYNPWGFEITLKYTDFIENVSTISYVDLNSKNS